MNKSKVTIWMVVYRDYEYSIDSIWAAEELAQSRLVQLKIENGTWVDDFEIEEHIVHSTAEAFYSEPENSAQ